MLEILLKCSIMCPLSFEKINEFSQSTESAWRNPLSQYLLGAQETHQRLPAPVERTEGGEGKSDGTQRPSSLVDVLSPGLNYYYRCTQMNSLLNSYEYILHEIFILF